MFALPAPGTCHWLLGVPGLRFSQATRLTTGSSHGNAAEAGSGTVTAATITRRCYDGAKSEEITARHLLFPVRCQFWTGQHCHVAFPALIIKRDEHEKPRRATVNPWRRLRQVVG
jgi:hypothetical protein